jgi:hypothetical protein
MVKHILNTKKQSRNCMHIELIILLSCVLLIAFDVVLESVDTEVVFR